MDIDGALKVAKISGLVGGRDVNQTNSIHISQIASDAKAIEASGGYYHIIPCQVAPKAMGRVRENLQTSFLAHF